MNRQDFNLTGGYPFETDTLYEMQKAYDLFNALGEMAGGNAILRDCTDDGENVSDGIVYTKGEVLEFRGGPRQPSVLIQEDTASKVFEDGQEHPVLYKRYMTFGSGPDALNWRTFKRYRLTEVEDQLAGKAPLVHKHDDRYYTQHQLDQYFAETKTHRQALTAADLLDRHPQLELYHFSALKNQVGCATLSLAGNLTGYKAPCGFVNLMTLPEGFRPSTWVGPISCFVSFAEDKSRWDAFPCQIRPLRLTAKGEVYLYFSEAQAISRSLHLHFSTAYMI